MFNTDSIIISNCTRTILLQCGGDYGEIFVDVPKTGGQYHIITGAKMIESVVNGHTVKILRVTTNTKLGDRRDMYTAYSVHDFQNSIYTLRTSWMSSLEDLLTTIKKYAITEKNKSITIPYMDRWGDIQQYTLTEEDICNEPLRVLKYLKDHLFDDEMFISVNGNFIYGIKNTHLKRDI